MYTMADDTLQDVRERLIRIETLLENSNMTIDLKLRAMEEKFTTMDEKIKVQNHRINDLENNNTWLWRTVIGGLIGIIIGNLFKII